MARANDLAPAEQRLVHDYIARLRTQLVRMLDGQGLPPAPRRFGLRHSLLTHLTFVDVAVEELKPHHMRGYGAVAPEAAAALNGIVEELHGTIGQITRALSVDRSEDLRARLARLGSGADAGLLDTLEELVRKYGLVEFRSALSTIVDTLVRISSGCCEPIRRAWCSTWRSASRSVGESWNRSCISCCTR